MYGFAALRDIYRIPRNLANVDARHRSRRHHHDEAMAAPAAKKFRAQTRLAFNTPRFLRLPTNSELMPQPRLTGTDIVVWYAI